MKTKAVIFEKFGVPLFLDEIILPEIGKDEVIVKLYASGICGSQIYDVTNPNAKNVGLLGHEGTGVVVKAGKNVEHVQEGDDVLISWMPVNAQQDNEYLQWVTVKWRDQDVKAVLFTWAEETILHKQFVTKMDKSVDKYNTSIIGCAGIAGYGTVKNTVNIKENDSVAVFGAGGGLGVLAINAAKNLNADPIIAVDVDDDKLNYAKEFGATHFINAINEDVVAKIHEISGGGVDYVFDMVGSKQLTDQTIMSTKVGVPGFSEGGTTVIVGFPKELAPINTKAILMGQKTYKGSRGGACIPSRDFPIFWKEYNEGKFLIDKAVTKTFTLENINDAVEELKAGKIVGRAIIKIS